MPELPEVETIVRELQASALIGAVIKEVEVFWERSIACPEPLEFIKQLREQMIVAISRRGKFIVFTLSQCTLLVHLRMTGKFFLSSSKLPIGHHERIRVHFSDQRFLHYSDQRKFGKWYLLEHPEVKLKELGLEPLSEAFTVEALKVLLSKSSALIKPFLLSQKYVVGLGNIYVDEALWLAKISPLRKANTLKPKEIKTLHSAITTVLNQGLLHRGTSLGTKQANYFNVSGRHGGNQTLLNVFRRDGLPCLRCLTPIAKTKVAQRSTHFCLRCQK